MNEIFLFSLFLVLAIALVVFALLVVKQKSLVYSALSLGLLGMVNAGIFAMLGYTFIALFHLAVYIGAAVIFILFAVTMFREAPEIELSTKILALIAIPLIALALIYIYLPFSDISFTTKYFTYRGLSLLFIEKYSFPLIVTALALVTTLIEAITLARKEVEEVA
jgi:NADH-quinone oxidoreductase subunit J